MLSRPRCTKPARGEASDQIEERQTALLDEIGDLPATSPDDILLKLAFCMDVYVGEDGLDDFTEHYIAGKLALEGHKLNPESVRRLLGR